MMCDVSFTVYEGRILNLFNLLFLILNRNDRTFLQSRILLQYTEWIYWILRAYNFTKNIDNNY